MFARPGIRARLFGAFGLLILLLLGVIAAGLAFLGAASSTLREVVDRRYATDRHLRDAHAAVLRIHSDVWDAMLLDVAARRAAEAGLRRAGTEFYRHVDELATAAPGDGRDLAAVRAAFGRYFLYGTTILGFPGLEALRDRREAVEKFRANKDELAALLDAAAAGARERLAASIATLDERVTLARSLAPFVAGGAVLFSFLFAIVFAARVSRPLVELASFARAMAAGDLGARPVRDLPGEAGELGLALDTMASSLERTFEELGAEIEERARTETALRETEEQLRLSLAEKEVLLREVHHRVKNNMQVISSLLNMQENRLADEEDRRPLADARRRIRALALVHERLYRGADLACVDFAGYLRALVDELGAGMASGRRPAFHVDAEGVRLPLDLAIPCGLLVNELCTNALKHAYPADFAGPRPVRISARAADGRVDLVVADDGVGMGAVDPAGGETLGHQLVAALAAQVDGTLSRDPGPGTSVRISFPLKG